jgi:hypothetical protein
MGDLTNETLGNSMIENFVVWLKHGKRPSVRVFFDEKENTLNVYGVDVDAVNKVIRVISQ